MIAFALLLSAAAFSQEEPSDKIYDIKGIEVSPEFPGGKAEFYKYVGENLKGYGKTRRER